MIPEWLKDGRKIPDHVMYYIRGMAVYAIRELGHSPQPTAQRLLPKRTISIVIVSINGLIYKTPMGLMR